MSDKKTIVLDHGSGSIKVGYAGEETPRSIFPSIVGYPAFVSALIGCEMKDSYIGEESLENSPVLTQKYPVKHGIVYNWDDVEKIWEYIFKKKLKIDPSEHPILLTEAVMNPKANREKMIQLMFETFNVPSFYVALQGILSLYASGRTTGLVFEVGDGVTQIIPIYKSRLMTHTIKRFNFGGKDQTKFLRKILIERGYYLTTTEELQIVQDIKEKLGYVATNYDQELQKSRSTSECDTNYTLPDGNVMYISDERFRCAELLYKPHMNGLELKSMIYYIEKSISKCDIGMQNDLYNNIILAGGSTMFKGFPERIYQEFYWYASQNTKINVIADSNRYIYDWRGGSILASNAQFPEMVITHDEYNDAGPGIAHRKCW